MITLNRLFILLIIYFLSINLLFYFFFCFFFLLFFLFCYYFHLLFFALCSFFALVLLFCYTFLCCVHFFNFVVFCSIFLLLVGKVMYMSRTCKIIRKIFLFQTIRIKTITKFYFLKVSSPSCCL